MESRSILLGKMLNSIKMETVFGEPKELVFHEEMLVPACIADGFGDVLSFIKHIQYKQGDVLLCSYPKCGTHWVGSIIRELTNSSKNINNYRPSMDILELTPPDTIKGILNTSQRMFTTHLRPCRLPKDLIDNRCRIVLVLRNPKDVAVSAFHQLRNAAMFANKQSWDEFFVSFIEGKCPYGSYFDYLDDWEAVIRRSQENKCEYNIEIFYYEELKRNTVINIRRLSQHLGVFKDDIELKQIERLCSIGSLREKAKHESAGIPSTLKGTDGQSVLYRKGDVGDWKNHFTVAQNEAFDKLIESRQADSTFEFIYE